MSLFRTRRIGLVGVDITADEIRLLQLNYGQDTWSVENVAVAPLPPQAIVEGQIKQIAIVQERLSDLVRQTKTRNAAAAIAMPATLVMTQRIKLAAELTPQECEMEISDNLGRYLPVAVDELCFDFVNLPSVENSQQEILLVAARQEQLNTYLSLATNAGLKLKFVDVDSYALLRAASLSCVAQLDAVVAVLDVHEGVSRFMVFQQRQIIFSHYWEASDLTQLQASVQRALDLFKVVNPQSVIRQLILSGQIASWQHKLVPYLQTTLAVMPQLAQPFRHMKIAPGVKLAEDLIPRLQICCGLAMRGACA